MGAGVFFDFFSPFCFQFCIPLRSPRGHILIIFRGWLATKTYKAFASWSVKLWPECALLPHPPGGAIKNITTFGSLPFASTLFLFLAVAIRQRVNLFPTRSRSDHNTLRFRWADGAISWPRKRKFLPLSELTGCVYVCVAV